MTNHVSFYVIMNWKAKRFEIYNIVILKCKYRNTVTDVITQNKKNINVMFL